MELDNLNKNSTINVATQQEGNFYRINYMVNSLLVVGIMYKLIPQKHTTNHTNKICYSMITKTRQLYTLV